MKELTYSDQRNRENSVYICDKDFCVLSNYFSGTILFDSVKTD